MHRALLVFVVFLFALVGCYMPTSPTRVITREPTRVVTAKATPSQSTVPVPTGDDRPIARIPATERNGLFSDPAPISIKSDAIYQATIATDKGNIVVELYPDAPQGVNNFVTLAKNGFYDGLTFHRIEPGFVIQGGDPKGDGTGGPGYTIPAEIKHRHQRGALAWARTGDQVNPERRSSGSQFYITLSDTPFLEDQYSVFGQVVEGLGVLDKIAVGDKITWIQVKEAQSRAPTPAVTRPSTGPVLPIAPKPEALVRADPCLRVREGPGLGYNILACLAPNTRVVIEGRARSQQPWVKVTAGDGTIGWMSADPNLLRYTVAFDSLPSAFFRPGTGVVESPPTLDGDGEFRVTNSGSLDSVIILAKANRTVVAIYVRNGESFTLEGVPDGDYKVYYSVGADWDGSAFHRDAKRRMFTESFPFTTSKTEATIWEVKIQTLVGNTSGQEVNVEDFPSVLSSIPGS